MAPLWGLRRQAGASLEPVVGEGLLPPVKSIVQIGLATSDGEAPAPYISRIILRQAPLDYLDAMRHLDGDRPVDVHLARRRDALLWWGDGVHLLEYRIRVRNVIDPIPSLEVEYVSEPVRRNRRHEVRSPATVLGFILPTDETGSPERTTIRDISLSGFRFFSRVPYSPDDSVMLSLDLGSRGWLAHPVRVVRCEPSERPYRGVSGHDIGAIFAPPLEADEAERWTAYLAVSRTATP